MEKSNNGNKGYVEEELYNQTGLEESKARADVAASSTCAEEGGGALRGDGDDNTEEAHDDEIKIRKAEGENGGVG